jgi:hypothetical protein
MFFQCGLLERVRYWGETTFRLCDGESGIKNVAGVGTRRGVANPAPKVTKSASEEGITWG